MGMSQNKIPSDSTEGILFITGEVSRLLVYAKISELPVQVLVRPE